MARCLSFRSRLTSFFHSIGPMSEEDVLDIIIMELVKHVKTDKLPCGEVFCTPWFVDVWIMLRCTPAVQPPLTGVGCVILQQPAILLPFMAFWVPAFGGREGVLMPTTT